MKYLENLSLENISNALTNRELGGGLVINGRIEVYSTKRAGEDKKNSKILVNKMSEIVDSNSGLGDLSKVTKNLLVNLIQTLNASLVDYDFSELSPDSFSQINIQEAVQNINGHFAELTLSDPNFINRMWKEISDCMGQLMTHCEVYKLTDGMILDEEEDESSIWSFNYFFCNKELKRICYFKCIATSKFRTHNSAGASMAGGGNGMLRGGERHEHGLQRDWKRGGV